MENLKIKEFIVLLELIKPSLFDKAEDAGINGEEDIYDYLIDLYNTLNLLIVELQVYNSNLEFQPINLHYLYTNENFFNTHKESIKEIISMVKNYLEADILEKQKKLKLIEELDKIGK